MNRGWPELSPEAARTAAIGVEVRIGDHWAVGDLAALGLLTMLRLLEFLQPYAAQMDAAHIAKVLRVEESVVQQALWRLALTGCEEVLGVDK